MDSLWLVLALAFAVAVDREGLLLALRKSLLTRWYSLLHPGSALLDSLHGAFELDVFPHVRRNLVHSMNAA